MKRPTSVFDPLEEGRALAFHMGREEGALREPMIGAKEVGAELHTAELECVMTETPNDAPIRRLTA